MAESRGPSYAAVIAIVLAGILLSLIVGCFGGAVAGYLAAGFRANRLVAQAPFPRWGQTPQRPWQTPPMPELPPEEGIPWLHGWPSGALVRYVEPRSPADEGGIKPGDIITAVDDNPVDEEHSLSQVLQGYRPGDTVEITVIREGEELTLRVKLGSHPDDETRPYLGVRFSMVTAPFFHKGR